MQISTPNLRISRHAMAIAGVLVLLAAATSAPAQMVQYNEQLGAYKDQKESGVRLQDGIFPAVSAKSRVRFALANNTVVDQAALQQPDGTLKLPNGQQSVVIRTDYTNVARDPNGVLRVASPTIEGNVSGNVTLYVDGKGVQNITVLNNPR